MEPPSSHPSFSVFLLFLSQSFSLDTQYPLSHTMDSGSNATQLDNVGIDFVREVSIQTSNYSAEYGRNDAASVNVVTKSGGNSRNTRRR